MSAPHPPSAPGGPPGPRRRTLRTQLAVTLVLAVGLPLLAAGLVGATLLWRRESQAAEQSLTNIAVAVARQVEAHLKDHLDVVREVAAQAEVAGRLDRAGAEAVLARVHALHPELRTMLVTDPDGWILAVDPVVDRQGRPMLAAPRSVADREYFQEPMRTGQPHVSGVFLGRGLGSDPIVAVSAPVVLHGRRAGVVEGSLDVSQMPLVEGLVAPAPFEVVLLDDDDRVVWATAGSGYRPLQPLREEPLGQARLGLGKAVGRYQRDGEELLVASAALRGSGWHAVLQARADEVGRGARSFLLLVTVTLLCGVAVALGLAVWLAGRATRPLERLGRSVAGFLKGEAAPQDLLEPGAPREVAELVGGYEALQRRIGRTLSGLLPVCAWCRRIRDGEARWHALEDYVEARFDATVTHGICPECERKVHLAPEPGDLQR